jgi:hypothetical protein
MDPSHILSPGLSPHSNFPVCVKVWRNNFSMCLDDSFIGQWPSTKAWKTAHKNQPTWIEWRDLVLLKDADFSTHSDFIQNKMSEVAVLPNRATGALRTKIQTWKGNYTVMSSPDCTLAFSDIKQEVFPTHKKTEFMLTLFLITHTINIYWVLTSNKSLC